MVEEETGGGTVVDDELDDTAGTSLVDDEVDDTAEAPVVDDGGVVATSRLVVDVGRVVVERAVAGGAVGEGATEVVESPGDSSTMVVLVSIMARVSTGPATGSLVGGRLEVVEVGGFAGEVLISKTVVAISNVVASVRVTSGERAGRQSTTATTAMVARVTAIRAFSTGRAIRTSFGTE